ncbi:agmatinase [Colwellia sp. 1_MG-2023]|uniref:agmatinase n=1 Tax=unclassified Colwellia TaxID=196834 RepID=UPI001C09CAEE|nr:MULTISPECIES: agmatinase [unclassified Colwellia]MBU2925519.1 agmatinase [Colwellia sp. C2M11]MDO6651512.1 agmatinase [Colwellia sp. 3_MG-2023]MDO6667063.1 agmatinase [Colwellia sp. 2_MG-2023]MDO6690913.1 agmatinase [Colwellia sp. 1_MG-2023]
MKNIFNQVDGSIYSNAMTFLRQPLVKDPVKSAADIVILGLPFDMATTGRSGARMGPTAIRQASVNLAWEGKRFPWPFSLLKHCKIVDAGDLVFSPGDSAHFCQQVETAVGQLLASDKTVLSLGGDHFVTLPILRAYAKKFGTMALIHFDAHTDTYNNGSCYDHGTMFYHAPKENLIDRNKSIQVGIRTNYRSKDHGFSVINAMQANDISVDEITTLIKDRVGNMPVYLTFDIDCLDPAFAPGTGTPVCGGMSTDKVLKVLRGLSGINIIGMDVVEVAPAYDNSEVTSLAAATIALELAHLWTVKHKRQ